MFSAIYRPSSCCIIDQPGLLRLVAYKHIHVLICIRICSWPTEVRLFIVSINKLRTDQPVLRFSGYTNNSPCSVAVQADPHTIYMQICSYTHSPREAIVQPANWWTAMLPIGQFSHIRMRCRSASSAVIRTIDQRLSCYMRVRAATHTNLYVCVLVLTRYTPSAID